GAETAQVDPVLEVPGDLTAGFDQAAHRALGVGGTGVEQDAIAIAAGIDPLADRAGRITAFQRDRGDQQMGQRMQQDIREPGKLASALVVILLPALEPRVELLTAAFDCGLLPPGVDRFASELDEDALTAVLDGR